jgi:hypothetical protein
MKKLVSAVVVLVLFLSGLAFCLETSLLDTRNKIFQEAQEIKSLFEKSKDVILINSLWDSCIMLVNQLDAYFYMVGIFNDIKKNDVTDSSVDYLMRWLDTIKKTNDLNIKSLASVDVKKLENKSRVYVERLKGKFSELNQVIDVDLKKISALKKPEKPKKI